MLSLCVCAEREVDPDDTHSPAPVREMAGLCENVSCPVGYTVHRTLAHSRLGKFAQTSIRAL